MKAVEIKKDTYWLGVIDWNVRYFHGATYSTHRGTTYNSYLLLDDEPTLVDTVYTPFAGELLASIKTLIDPKDIKYIVVNHVEVDHAGALPQIMEAAPDAVILCSPKAAPVIDRYFNSNWEKQIVKTGDTVSIGKKTLSFIEAPMLHWPDSMFTYVPEEKLLLPNDAFGQHLAASTRFDDDTDLDVMMQEAKKYYANILLPFGPLVVRKIEEVVKLGIEIDMIAPSHGNIWRSDPGKIIDAYLRWGKGENKKKATVVYETIWGSTEKMAHAILEGLVEGGMEANLYKMSVSDSSDVIAEMIDSELVVVGSATLNRDFLPKLSVLLDDLMGLKPKNKRAALFASSGWSGGAIPNMEERVKKAGFTLADEDKMEIFWTPHEEDLEKCREFGLRLAGSFN
ncbi:MAG: MBL fold metallo-hydrolase [Bacillota bacterium]|nr:MBL fold metallo-hydrolase [Bacillota bacterium]MDW7684187.1 MBL fold metallo-hydrolase [Bacillota bacterium]